MKDAQFNYESVNSPQNSDIISGLLAISFFASKLASIESLLADLSKKMYTKAAVTPSANAINTDWRSCELVSVKKCAVILDQSEKTVKNLIKRGLLEHSQGIRHIKITTRSLIEYVDRTV